jgi:pimeloyl-ACP methyl ester carboxylesterase
MSTAEKSTSFGPLNQIDAGLLNVGYAEAGPPDGPAVILVHGWPYDIHSYVDVAPLLAAEGYRVIVPYVRGYGTTRFLSDATFRNGQQSALAVDTIALMDALDIDQAIVAGFDWAARTADVVAALWPERCKALVAQWVPDRQPGRRQAAIAPGGGAPTVVPVLLRHRTRPGRLREIPPRLREAHLADCLAEVGFRRRHVRSQRSVVQQSGSRRDRDSQLPLAARDRRGHVAAFAPDEGEKLGDVEGASKDSVLNSALVPHQYPTASGTGTEFSIDPAKARDAFAADLSEAQAALVGTIQRPVADLAFGEPSGAPAWKNLPSWAVVATGDKAAGTDVVRSMAERAGADITQVDGSHVIMISQPDVVTDVIMK